MQHSYCTDIPWGEAQPGDLVFYPDDSHVGIAGGTDADGNLLIVHCSGGANGVVITGSAGFTAVASPNCLKHKIYGETHCTKQCIHRENHAARSDRTYVFLQQCTSESQLVQISIYHFK